MLILVFTFVILLLFTTAVVMLLTRPTRTAKALQARLANIRNPRKSQDKQADAADLERSRELTVSGRLSLFLEPYAVTQRLHSLLLQSHSRMTVVSFIVVSAAVATAAVAFLVAFIPFLFEPLVFMVGATFPYIWLSWVRASLLKSFARGLPDAIELMARALRAGHSIKQAIELIAEQAPEPLSSEFAQVHQEQKFGLPFRDALLQMSKRVASRDLHFFITAILVQKETGSDLIEILDRTTVVIRDRIRVEGQVKTYTAQGRLTGWILSVLPVVLLTIISVVSPDYSTILFHDPVGQKLLLSGAVMIIIGALMIRKIVAVEI
jgi:tight adherence protein B